MNTGGRFELIGFAETTVGTIVGSKQ